MVSLNSAIDSLPLPISLGGTGRNAYTNLYSITPWIVGPTNQAGYQTIQSAINAAVSVGGLSQCIYVKPGTYTENLDFSGATALSVGLTLVGASALGDEGQVEIIGHHTPPSSGTLILRNFKLSDSTHIFTSSVVGTAHLVIIDAELNVTNGYTFDLINWSGIFELFDINPGSGNDGAINNTGGATLFMFSSGLGSGTSNTMNLSGLVVVGEADISCPVNFGTGSNITIDVVQFAQSVTFSGNSTGNLNTCRFSGGASAAITMSSTASVQIGVTIIESSHNPAIAGSGAGTLILGDITFLDNSSLAGTLTIAYLPSILGSTTINGNITLPTAGNKLNIATGSNASIGSFNLSSGSATTVSTNAVTASSMIFLSRLGINGSTALGELTVANIVNGMSFDVYAATLATPGTPLTGDTSTVSWLIIN